MMGDAYDIQLMLNWASWLWGDGIQGFTWSVDFRTGVAFALKNLVQTFGVIVGAHKTEFRMDDIGHVS